VGEDQDAAREMVRRTGQMGVPVTVAGDDVIVGFDQPRLERLAQRLASHPAEDRKPRLGLRVKDAPGGGAEVGSVRPDSAAGRAGVRPGDVVESLQGRPVRSAAELEHIAEQLHPGEIVEIWVRRESERTRIDLRL
jgi:S1-C subfamily serine protease